MNWNALGLSRKSSIAIMVVVLLLVSWLGIRGLNMDSIWVDEYWSLYDSGGATMGPLSLSGVWNRVAEQDPWQSPGYYLALNLWGKEVGWSEFATRALSLLFGLLAVAWTYRLGHDLISPFGGIAAAITLGISAYFIYYLHEMRGYTLYVLFTAWTVWAYWRLLKGGGTRGTYALLFLGIAGALYTHYFAALTAVALGVIHVTAGVYLLRKNRRRWWAITAMFAGAAVAFLPWLIVLVSAIGRAASESAARAANGLSTEHMVTGMLYLFSNGGTALLVFLLLFSLRWRWRNIFVWVWFLIVLIALIAINAQLGVILEVRYMLGLWPALAILAGFSLDRLRNFQPSLPSVVFAVWIIGGVWVSVSPEAANALSNPHWHLPWREYKQVIETRAQPGDAAIFLLPDWTWAVYHTKDMQYYLDDLPSKASLLEQPGHIGSDQYLKDEQDAIQNMTRVWAGSTPAQPLTHFDLFEKILTQNDFLHCARPAETDLLDVDLYARASAAQADAALVFDDPTAIRVVPFQALPATASDLLSLTFLWQIADPYQAQRYSVAFHLQDALGNVVAQIDQGIPTESTACSLYELGLQSLPTGDYTLFVTVYQWETGTRLALTGQDYQVAPDRRVILGKIHIERKE